MLESIEDLRSNRCHILKDLSEQLQPLQKVAQQIRWRGTAGVGVLSLRWGGGCNRPSKPPAGIAPGAARFVYRCKTFSTQSREVRG
jgi:hypothetical protein